MDVSRVIRIAADTGETKLGVKEAQKEIDAGNAELLIVAENCPEEDFLQDEYEGVPIYHFEGNNHELGAVAGKPFTVSTITIIEPGESDVMALTSS